MKYRNIGETGLSVSEIGFGAWTIGDDWWGHISDDEAVSLIREALDLGINFFDTADGYGDGRSESLIGKAIGDRRDKVVLSTKFGYQKSDRSADRSLHQERSQDFDPQFIRESLHGSLRRLETDRVDIYHLHNAKIESLVRDETFECLDDLKQQGLIGHYGVALGPRIGWGDEGEFAIRERGIATIHMIFNLLEQVPGRELMSLAAEQNISSLIRVPLSSGILAGEYTLETTFDASDHRSHRDRAWLENGVKVVEKLRFLEGSGLRSLKHAAIKYILSCQTVASVLPTITNSVQLRDFALAPDAADLTADDLERLDEFIAESVITVA